MDDFSKFKCLQCGACCQQDGYVRLREGESDKIAAYLNMAIYAFIEKYTRITRDRKALSLIDKENGECIFLGPQGCRIQAVKPGQCLDFPQKWKFKAFSSICAWGIQQSKKIQR
ncbi:MAG: YkgJ family cysteine cluster protein [Proteobacteria bacterium]|nr:YkgJ family cysteine cluster protein [Pseudomonadota bacterium]MBU1386402.1 YkgJ family cysteine cluster protein [Pseudomonadota bacterium]MBU1544513.1 YkgJ family cysteine cluster protein [Pseudomonadota bacterium]MBU2480107.1 YkgJ family cysteine cluster protein [Pseudomonadota bacterium]